LRKKKGSANRTKAKAWICKAACQDCQYPAGGLAQAHLMAQAMISPRACRRAESGRHGEEPVILPAFYPTWVSQSFGDNWSCSAWGRVQETLPLAIRQWVCPEYGSIHDREVNGAKNILTHGLAVLNGLMTSCAKCEAGGEKSSCRRRMTMGKTVLCEAGS
jgi:hypothetical protein